MCDVAFIKRAVVVALILLTTEPLGCSAERTTSATSSARSVSEVRVFAEVGTEADTSLVVENTGRIDLILACDSLEAPFRVPVELPVVRSGARYSLPIFFLPETIGSYSSPLVCRDDTGVLVQATVRGVAVAPCPAPVSPCTVGFLDTEPGLFTAGLAQRQLETT